MDISDFYQAFFDEADELMADMEKYLLELDLEAPDREVLNAIFRAAHSIKGGAGTFGFTVLQQTMHILENLLDDVRSGKLQINDPIRDLFLESKDIMQDQLDAYKASAEPDQEAFRYICEALRQIALDSAEPTTLPAEVAAPLAVEPVAPPVAAAKPEGERLRIILSAVKEEDQQPLIDELGNLGKVSALQTDQTGLQLTLATTATPDDILAVLCFILEPEQIAISPAPVEEPSVPAIETTAPAQSSAAPAVRAARPETARETASGGGEQHSRGGREGGSDNQPGRRADHHPGDALAALWHARLLHPRHPDYHHRSAGA